MAQGLRPRSLEPARSAALLAWLAACGGDSPPTPPPAVPRTVDTAAIADGDLVAAVLDECHRPLRGALDRLAAVVRLPDGTDVQLFAQLPDRLRANTRDDRFLFANGTVVRLDFDKGAEVTPTEATLVRRLCTLLDAAALGPLHRASACRRLGSAEFELTQPAGAPWRLTLQPGTLLPRSLVGPDGEVRILDHLRTSSTWMVKRAALDGLGACDVQFEFADLAWDADFFVPPAARAPKPDARQGGERQAMQMPLAAGEPRSPVPVLIDAKAARRVAVADPGTWPERVAAYRPLHAEVERQDQQVAGFPQLWSEDGQRRLGLSFRQRPGGPAFAPPDGWLITDVPAGRWLVVYPPSGDLAARVAAGTAALEQALAQQGLRAAGPITAQPFLHLQEGEPAADKLADPVVRVAVPVR